MEPPTTPEALQALKSDDASSSPLWVTALLLHAVLLWFVLSTWLHRATRAYLARDDTLERLTTVGFFDWLRGKRSLSLLFAVVSCRGEPTSSSSTDSAPSAPPSVLTTTRQPAKVVLHVTSGDVDVPITIADAAHPKLVLRTVKGSERERAFHDLFRTYGNVVVGLAIDREVPHAAVISLLEDLRLAGFKHLQFVNPHPLTAPSRIAR